MPGMPGWLDFCAHDFAARSVFPDRFSSLLPSSSAAILLAFKEMHNQNSWEPRQTLRDLYQLVQQAVGNTVEFRINRVSDFFYSSGIPNFKKSLSEMRGFQLLVALADLNRGPKDYERATDLPAVLLLRSMQSLSKQSVSFQMTVPQKFLCPQISSDSHSDQIG